MMNAHRINDYLSRTPDTKRRLQESLEQLKKEDPTLADLVQDLIERLPGPDTIAYPRQPWTDESQQSPS